MLLEISNILLHVYVVTTIKTTLKEKKILNFLVLIEHKLADCVFRGH